MVPKNQPKKKPTKETKNILNLILNSIWQIAKFERLKTFEFFRPFSRQTCHVCWIIHKNTMTLTKSLCFYREVLLLVITTNGNSFAIGKISVLFAWEKKGKRKKVRQKWRKKEVIKKRDEKERKKDGERGEKNIKSVGNSCVFARKKGGPVL